MKKQVFIGIILIVTFLLTLSTPGHVTAGQSGGGGEPGAGCPGGDKYQFVTLAYVGTVTLEWRYENLMDDKTGKEEKTDTVWISGEVTRVPDKRGDTCWAKISTPIRYDRNITIEDFQMANEKDLRGHCARLDFWNDHKDYDLFQAYGESCKEDPKLRFWEIIDVDNMKWDSPTKFTVDVSIMGIQKK